jgi:nitrite reductase (NO-forming)
MELKPWQTKGLGIIRILFGVVLSIDASFKWSPAFLAHFGGYLTDAAQAQPHYVQAWIGMWNQLVNMNPTLFAYLIAFGETFVAAGLLLGAFSAIVDLFGALLMLLIWSTAEGFGGPYKPGSTDIGTAVIYVIVFAALFFSGAGSYLGVDGVLQRQRRYKLNV